MGILEVNEMKKFMMSMNQKTVDFLVKWYNLPIQDILRVLASVDVVCKEQGSFVNDSQEYLKKLQEEQKCQ